MAVVDFFFDPDDPPPQSAADTVEPNALDKVEPNASPSSSARPPAKIHGGHDPHDQERGELYVAPGAGEKIRMLGQHYYPDRAPQFVATRDMSAPSALTAKMTASHAHRRTLRHIPGGGVVLAVVFSIPLWALIISVFVWLVR